MLIVIVIAVVLAFDFVFFMGIAAGASKRESFDREQEDREQMKAIEEYMRKKVEKKQARKHRVKSRARE